MQSEISRKPRWGWHPGVPQGPAGTGNNHAFPVVLTRWTMVPQPSVVGSTAS